MSLLRLSLELPGGVAYVPALRRTARCLLESVGVLGGDVEDIEILIGELATNAVLHAGGPYQVELVYREEWVTLSVTDCGSGFSPANLPPPGTVRPDTLSGGGDERLGGWGLPLVRMLADRVEIGPNEPCGTRVCAEKRLRPTVEAPLPAAPPVA
jgi:anti-sigma regulatory factor (Ser/Thr protein kinase)